MLTVPVYGLPAIPSSEQGLIFRRHPSPSIGGEHAPSVNQAIAITLSWRSRELAAMKSAAASLTARRVHTRVWLLAAVVAVAICAAILWFALSALATSTQSRLHFPGSLPGHLPLGDPERPPGQQWMEGCSHFLPVDIPEAFPSDYRVIPESVAPRAKSPSNYPALTGSFR